MAKSIDVLDHAQIICHKQSIQGFGVRLAGAPNYKSCFRGKCSEGKLKCVVPGSDVLWSPEIRMSNSSLANL